MANPRAAAADNIPMKHQWIPVGGMLLLFAIATFKVLELAP